MSLLPIYKFIALLNTIDVLKKYNLILVIFLNNVEFCHNCLILRAFYWFETKIYKFLLTSESIDIKKHFNQ